MSLFVHLVERIRSMFLPPVPKSPRRVRLTPDQFTVSLQDTEELTPVRVEMPVYTPLPVPSSIPVKRPTSPLRKQKRITEPLSWEKRQWFPMTSYRASIEPLLLVKEAINHFAAQIYWLPYEVFLSSATYEEYLAVCNEPVYRRGDYEITVRPWPGLGADVCVCSGVA